MDRGVHSSVGLAGFHFKITFAGSSDVQGTVGRGPFSLQWRLLVTLSCIGEDALSGWIRAVDPHAPPDSPGVG